MKKFLTAALALVLLLTLAACGGREGKEDPSGSPALYGVSEVQSVVDAGAFSESLEEVDADTAFALYKLADYGLERENMYDASVTAPPALPARRWRCFVLTARSRLPRRWRPWKIMWPVRSPLTRTTAPPRSPSWRTRW